jgi:hypothetical protein
VSRGRKVRPSPRDNPVLLVPLVLPALRVRKTRKGPWAHKVRLANAAQPVQQDHPRP